LQSYYNNEKGYKHVNTSIDKDEKELFHAIYKHKTLIVNLGLKKELNLNEIQGQGDKKE
jgi:hypothetical protein